MAELTGLPLIFLLIVKSFAVIPNSDNNDLAKGGVRKDGEKWTVLMLNVYGSRINKIWHLRLWLGVGGGGWGASRRRCPGQEFKTNS